MADEERDLWDRCELGVFTEQVGRSIICSTNRCSNFYHARATMSLLSRTYVEQVFETRAGPDYIRGTKSGAHPRAGATTPRTHHTRLSERTTSTSMNGGRRP